MFDLSDFDGDGIEEQCLQLKNFTTGRVEEVQVLSGRDGSLIWRKDVNVSKVGGSNDLNGDDKSDILLLNCTEIAENEYLYDVNTISGVNGSEIWGKTFSHNIEIEIPESEHWREWTYPYGWRDLSGDGITDPLLEIECRCGYWDENASTYREYSASKLILIDGKDGSEIWDAECTVDEYVWLSTETWKDFNNDGIKDVLLGTRKGVYLLTISATHINSPPVAFFTYSPEKPKINQTVTFDASYSMDVDGKIVSYKWNFGDGKIGEGKIITHSYSSAGDYEVTLTVIDDKGSMDNTTKTVIVGNKPPIASFTFIPLHPFLDQKITFDASNSTDLDGTIVNYKWDFGDGTEDWGRIVTHSYSENKTYVVNLTVVDDDGATNSTNEKIVINNLQNNIIYVPNDYTTIQFAVDNATPGNTIIVNNGTYSENIKVNKPHLTIRSKNGFNVTIIKAANPDNPTFEISADYVNISGFQVEGGESTYYGMSEILIHKANNCIISKNKIINPCYYPCFYDRRGIDIYDHSNNNSIENNIFLNKNYGIYVHFFSCSNVIKNNVLLNTGIYLEGSSNEIVINNTVLEGDITLAGEVKDMLINNTLQGGGILINAWDIKHATTHTIEYNWVNDKPIYYYKNVNKVIVPKDAGEVILAKCSDIIVENINASNGSVGVELLYTTNSLIKDSNINLNNNGIITHGSLKSLAGFKIMWSFTVLWTKKLI